MTSVKTRTWQQSASEIVFEIDGETYTLDADITPVCEWIDPIMQRVGDKVVFAYAVVDDYPSAPSEWDGEGKIVLLSGRHSSSADMQEALAALGLNSDGNPDVGDIRYEMLEDWIAKYEHRHLWCAKEVHRRREAWKAEPDILSDEELLDEYSAYDCADELSAEFRDGDWDGARDVYREWYKFALEEWQRRRAAGTIGTKYTQVCDVYEHGGIHVSLSNTRGYPDEQWDVARGGAVWIPDQCAIDNIDDLLGPNSSQWSIKSAWDYAKGCIETWNMYWSGDVYGHVIEVHQYNEDGEYGDGTRVSEPDTCWEYYGSDYMKTVLQDELTGEVNFLLKNGGAA